MTAVYLLFFFLLPGCFNSADKASESKSINKTNTPTGNKLPSLVFRSPPDSTGNSGFEFVDLFIESGKSPQIKKSYFPDSTDVEIKISTKSGYEFSTFLRKNAEIKQDSFPAPHKLIAISDIEGNFDAFAEILISSEVVDSNFNWIFGENRLVLPGDFFDRGDEVFEVMWLIYKLEQQAEESGGGVHFILGNHEVMNLMGDHRYIHPKYGVFAEALKIPYKDWLAPGSVLGDWMRTKNCMEKIGENLFVHAGLSPQLRDSAWTVRDINNINRLAMNSSLDALRQKCRVITGTNGPLWYRDMSYNKIRSKKVKKILNHFGAEHVVVGHTIVNGEHISTLYDGRVINIDLYHLANFGKGIMRALLITEEGIFEIDNQGNKKSLG